MKTMKRALLCLGLILTLTMALGTVASAASWYTGTVDQIQSDDAGSAYIWLTSTTDSATIIVQVPDDAAKEWLAMALTAKSNDATLSCYYNNTSWQYIRY